MTLAPGSGMPPLITPAPPGEQQVRVIRPAAVLAEKQAVTIVKELERVDVSRGGWWNATTTVWQRYDKPWDGTAGTRGSSTLLGTIAVMYGSPRPREITIYKATVTAEGSASGWSVDRLCDDALRYADLTLATCPRAEMRDAPPPDPFRRGLDRLPPPR